MHDSLCRRIVSDVRVTDVLVHLDTNILPKQNITPTDFNTKYSVCRLSYLGGTMWRKSDIRVFTRNMFLDESESLAK
eukprot:scaffold126795_cov40-Attheya_sp.AAC.2